MESHKSCLLITYSAEIIDGVPLYVSSNCLPVKALKYEPAGHSFHAVAMKLFGLGEQEDTETDNHSVSSDDKAKILLLVLIHTAAKERRSPLGVNNRITMHCLGWVTCGIWPLKTRSGKVTVIWLLNIIQISRLL
jgi:hypothetical protein